MMNFDNLPICIAMLALLSTPAVCGDPLNPGMLGETMDMPLPPDLVMKAVKAGVITSASEVTGSLPSGSQPVNAGIIAPQGTEAGSSLSGTLSLVLQDSVTRYLTLALQQKGDMIMGRGNMTSGSHVRDVTASGLMTGGQISLTVTTADSSDFYKLELVPEGNTIKGSYSAQSADGSAWSGTAAGVLPGVLPGNLPDSSQMTSAPEVSVSKTSAPLNLGATVGGAGASSSTAARAGPMQLDQSMGGGSSFSSSKSISMSTNGGGSMISSTSSTSF